jgi:uncharacterized protein YjbI with pentapeptide repeats
MTGARFDGASLVGAVARPMEMRKADGSLAGRRTPASFAGALLVGADLRAADLRGAIFAGCDLRGANMAGAFLAEADLATAKR